MSNIKLGIFSIVLLVAVAALFFPTTPLKTSTVNAQEYDPNYEENGYNNEGYYKDNSQYY